MTDFLASNWLWLAVLGFMIYMHLSGHGCGAHRHAHRDTSVHNAQPHARSHSPDDALGSSHDHPAARPPNPGRSEPGTKPQSRNRPN